MPEGAPSAEREIDRNTELDTADLSALYRTIAIDREANRKNDGIAKKDFFAAQKGASDIIIAIQKIFAPKRRRDNFWWRFRPAWRLFIEYKHKCVALRMATINKQRGFRGLIPHVKLHALHVELKSCNWPNEDEAKAQENFLAPPFGGWAIRTERMYLLVERRVHTINKYRAAGLFALHAAPYMKQFREYSKATAWHQICLAEWKRLKKIQRCTFYHHKKLGVCERCGVTNDVKSGPQKYKSDIFMDPRVNAMATEFFESVRVCVCAVRLCM
jgi:hypothetical protein